MRIAVNTRFLLKNKLEGFGWFTYEVFNRITKQHPEHEFIFLFDRKFDEKFVFSDNVTPVIVRPQARHAMLFYLWFEHGVKRVLKKYKADIFISPDGYLSLSSRVPAIAVMHDLNFEYYPRDLSYMNRTYYKKYFPKFARKADRIITVSEFSKADIVNHYDINPDKIDVAYNGAGDLFCPVDKNSKITIRKNWTGGEEYFIFVGALHPRKNIDRLLLAFDQFKEKTNSAMKLVMVGEKYRWSRDINRVYVNLKHQDDVVFTGHVPSEELNQLIGSAFAMIYVSYFEGFGIPVVEAMKCGTPVITSNVTALPEVAGDAALKADPFSVTDIVEAIERIVTNEKLRQELIEKGIERAKLFNWQNTADRVWESIQKLALEKRIT